MTLAALCSTFPTITEQYNVRLYMYMHMNNMHVLHTIETRFDIVLPAMLCYIRLRWPVACPVGASYEFRLLAGWQQ